MTTVQKLELGAGVLTPIIGWLAPLYLIYMRYTLSPDYGLGGKGDFLFTLGAVPFLLAVPVAFTSWFHVEKISALGLFAVFAASGLVVITFGVLAVFILAFGGFYLFGVFGLQACAAAGTAVLAASSHKRTAR